LDFPKINVSLPIHILFPDSNAKFFLSFQSSLFFPELKLQLSIQFLSKDDYIYTIRTGTLGTLNFSTLNLSLNNNDKCSLDALENGE